MGSRYVPPALRGKQASVSSIPEDQNPQVPASPGPSETSQETLPARELSQLAISTPLPDSPDARKHLYDRSGRTLYTVQEIHSHFRPANVQFSACPESSLNNSAERQDELAYLMLFPGANPRWKDDRIVFAKSNLELLPGFDEVKGKFEVPLVQRRFSKGVAAPAAAEGGSGSPETPQSPEVPASPDGSGVKDGDAIAGNGEQRGPIMDVNAYVKQAMAEHAQSDSSQATTGETAQPESTDTTDMPSKTESSPTPASAAEGSRVDTIQGPYTPELPAPAATTLEPLSPPIPTFSQSFRGGPRSCVFEGYYRIVRVDFLPPKSPQLVKMLEQKWTTKQGTTKARDASSWEASLRYLWAVIQFVDCEDSDEGGDGDVKDEIEAVKEDEAHGVATEEDKKEVEANAAAAEARATEDGEMLIDKKKTAPKKDKLPPPNIETHPENDPIFTPQKATWGAQRSRGRGYSRGRGDRGDRGSRGNRGGRGSFFNPTVDRPSRSPLTDVRLEEVEGISVKEYNAGFGKENVPDAEEGKEKVSLVMKEPEPPVEAIQWKTGDTDADWGADIVPEEDDVENVEGVEREAGT